MPRELDDANGAAIIRCRSLYRATIEAVSCYVVRDLKNVADWKRFRTGELLDGKDARSFENFSSMSFFPKRGSASKKIKKGVCAESSKDSLWPVDDDEENETGEVSDTSDALVNNGSRCSRDRNCKPTVDEFVASMRQHRIASNKPNRDSAKSFVESRCRRDLSLLDVVVDGILDRASRDARLPTELRELLPILHLYSFDANCETSEQASTWSIHLTVDREAALRNHRLVNGSKECRESYRSRFLDEEILQIDVFRVWSAQCAPESARALKGDLAWSVVETVWKKRSLRFTDGRVFAVYLMLHSLAKWQDTKELLDKPESEYFALLTLMFYRYPIV
ncbi:hypothetical protein CYMTET_3901 [Cymbomonas tetramitiformis]|uniref:Uncharacterized protein n=1 Tax=Cymbomonas tetramitiformis TaxID=36881 RepID=A0AAE0H2E5_9CHLO|nr:hypothetical protein CYMTET_3901 [Cymbomonas tetramitiformis]